ncbi:Mediator of RNA polymerase II transcription subunit 15a [Striga hermonthica]|uniref:Mediator of RNA polymerase II transcription subunit 15a n=1 Tax=Striga hermonthica TaxID=68872 RepID=A0A9N7NDY1_STRHE|nr:Mediator of RNA polymerase II transcription subunit 15a [Striga hermonthica]
MDSNNWRASQGQVQIPGQVIGGESAPNAGMEGGDWRTQLQPDSRQRIVNKIMETLKRHLPFSGQEGLQELKKIAVRFEEKNYTAATSQQDYLRKISLKMLTMETKSQNPMANSLQSNTASNSKAPQDPGSQSMHSQMQNQVQQLPIPLVSNHSQARQQHLSQNMQNNISAIGVPNSSGLTSTMPSVGGMTTQNPNMQNIQNMPNISGNAMGSSMGQEVSSNMYANSQRQQIQGQQQQVMTEEPQQQTQNSQQYLYNQQKLLKPNFEPGSIQQQPMMQSQMQQPQQQHNLLQQNQLQPPQQAVMQPSLRQISASPILQNQQTLLQQLTQSMLQPQSQSVLRQQQQPQQPSIMHEQQNSMPQHPIMPTQEQQQQQLSGQQPNNANIQPNQLIGQNNSILDAQQQQQQQQRMISQQNNMSHLQQQQAVGQQNHLQGMHQQQSTGQQNNFPNMHQQQLGTQSLNGFQQQQMVGMQHGTSSLQSNQQHVHMLQQPKVGVQQPMQSNLLPNQAQQPQSSMQLMSQIQSQPGQLQQQLGLQQQASTLQRDMQQRIQTAGPLHQQQTTIDQQKSLMQSQRVIPEVPLIFRGGPRDCHMLTIPHQRQQMLRQQLLQQQQQQSRLQQSVQLPGQQMMQLNPINDANDMKMRHQIGAKSGVLQQHSSSGQRQSYIHQQMKPGAPFSISSQQGLQATSPQISHQPSPQIDPTSHSKGGTPLHSANSPFIVPSPSTSMVPSPMPGDSEKPCPSVVNSCLLRQPEFL